LIAADKRISEGYLIFSGEYLKTTELTQKCCITSSGMVADIETLCKNLITKVKINESEHQGRSPDTESLAQLFSNTFYGRSSMPFYVFNLLCGLNKER
jgi:20S proteasome subunit beta 6